METLVVRQMCNGVRPGTYRLLKKGVDHYQILYRGKPQLVYLWAVEEPPRVEEEE